MAEIGMVISATLQIERIYGAFAKEANKLIPFDQLNVYIIEADRRSFTVKYVSGMDIPGRRPGDTLPIKGSIAEVAIINNG